MAGSAVTYGLVVGAIGIVSGWRGAVLTNGFGMLREERQEQRWEEAQNREEVLASDAAA